MTKPPQKAVFLDRDGTLIEDVGYLARVEDLRIFPFTFEAIRLLRENGFLVVVVTNQSGIGRKIYGEAAMHVIHERMQEDLENMLDGFYFCPHLPGGGCACRKPNLGMLEAARSDLEIDMNGSWMIGDKAIDIQTGSNAGIKTALVLTGYGGRDTDGGLLEPDVVGDDLLDAVKKIVISNRD
jgi:D-glycero-D-manno-heptose 1,7-bisphosphate phosphatase